MYMRVLLGVVIFCPKKSNLLPHAQQYCDCDDHVRDPGGSNAER
jgi:hypothetical protein